MTQRGVRESLSKVLETGCDPSGREKQFMMCSLGSGCEGADVTQRSLRNTLRSVLVSGCDAAEFERQFKDDFLGRM